MTPPRNILTLTETLTTRYQAQQIADANPGVDEIDFRLVEVYSVSAMDELVTRYPDATFVGMNDWAQQLYRTVINAINK